MYKGYSLFNDIESDLLQAWNRAETIASINKAMGEAMAQEYFEQFTGTAQMKIKILLMAVSASGRDEVFKRVKETLDGETELQSETTEEAQEVAH